MAFATFLVWRLRTGACGVGAYGFWRYRMPPVYLMFIWDSFDSVTIRKRQRLKRQTSQPPNDW